jgi:hypothetical protein
MGFPNKLRVAGSTTAGWQPVRLPLSAYAEGGVDRTRLIGFQIVFEWGNMSGTIYIDDIRLE